MSRKLVSKVTQSADAYTAANMVLEFRGNFALNDHFLLITDNGYHFANSLMELLAEKLRFKHRFSVAYTPYTNGSVEVINSLILRNLRVLTSEYSLDASEWPELIPIILHIINNKKGDLGLSPNEIFMGIDAHMEDPISTDLSFANKMLQMIQPKSKEKFIEAAVKISDELKKIHHRTHQYIKLRREVKNAALNQRSNVVIFQYNVGDLVLISRAGTAREKMKTKLRWNGPYTIIKIEGDHVYRVMSLLGDEHVVHASRMWFYLSANNIVPEPLSKIYIHD